MSIRIHQDETSLTVDSTPWATGILLITVIVGAMALALTGALAGTVPAAWWWLSGAGGVLFFAAFVSRETLHLDAASGQAHHLRRTAAGTVRRTAPLTALGDPRVSRRVTRSTSEIGQGPRLGRLEITVRGQAPWCVPDAFIGGTEPDRAAEAVRVFLAQRVR